MMDAIAIGRITDPSPRENMYRVLVDRLWPRGVKKDRAPWHEWLPAIAPSTDLRRWYHAHPQETERFRAQYLKELLDDDHQDAVRRLLCLFSEQPLMLLTYNKDVATSHVPIVKDFLMRS